MPWRDAARVHIVVSYSDVAGGGAHDMQAATKQAIRPDGDEPMLLEALDGGVLRLTLNRPAARNALSLALMGELRRALDDAAADRECRVVVIAGAGPAFCAGHDLRELRSNPSRETYERTFACCSALMLQIVRLAEAGHRRSSRHRHRGRLPAGRHLRSRGRRRGRAVRDAGGQYRAVLLDPDGRADPRRRAQGGDGDAADRRADRRRDREGARAGQPGRAAPPS